MTFDAYYSLGVLALAFYLLAASRLSADLVLIGGVVMLLAKGVLTTGEALTGLANEAVASVGVLFVVSAGVRDTGGVTWLAERLFGRPKSAQSAIWRLMIPTAGASAFMNNTPLVAMLIPAVNDWAKQCRIAVSKLMIPLSYAAILGGTCTLIGTSTNLVVNGLVISTAAKQTANNSPSEIANLRLPAEGLGMFDITWVGLPACIFGVTFVAIGSRWLLPDRKPPISNLDDPREYTVEMMVQPDSPLVGKSIEEAGLRSLPGVYLAEIDRIDEVLPAVSPNVRLRSGDRLVFVGIVESVVDLRKVRGLAPATDQVFKLNSPGSQRCLIEAVVSNSCPINGKTIREGQFRKVYDAAVIAVARNGERLHQKIGDIVLRPGDTLLLEGHPSFADRHRNSRDFFLVSRLENSQPPQHEKALIALLVLAGLVAVVATELLPVLSAALIAATLMLIFRCTSITEARRSIDWEVLLAIAASFAIGKALEKTGAADVIGGSMIGLAQGQAWPTLAVVYLATLLATEIITNNAAAALMFPMAMSTAASLNVSPMPFVIVVMMAASAGFATPIGYQTNLMVYGPGGYKFSDYVRLGVPLDILIWIVTVALTPIFFPF
ncbi:MAG: SLC13 family permease [Pirellulales bacterium]|nr:SLC13 family permease [Pirellulales bacterium]